MRPETASAPISFLMIPTIAVPVILLGTFAVLSATGFSINTQTMFGMVRSPSAEILGEPAPGLSTGSAMDTMEKLAEKLPPGIGLDWTVLAYEERSGGPQVGLVDALSLTVVFLSLAALSESWSIPVAVILVVPLGVLGAVLATFLRAYRMMSFFKWAF